MSKNINLYWIDLFCGAGGTSTGIHLAGSKVLACVNHNVLTRFGFVTENYTSDYWQQVKDEIERL